MQIEFLVAAQAELDEAIDYYNRERAGLGDEFLIEVLRTLERVAEYPGGVASLLEANAPLPDTTFPLRDRLSGRW